MTDTNIKGYVVQLEDGRYIGRQGITDKLSAQPFAFAYVKPTYDEALLFAQGWIGDPGVYAVVPVVMVGDQLKPDPAYLPGYYTEPTPALTINVYAAPDQWGDGIAKAVQHALKGGGRYHESRNYTPAGEWTGDSTAIGIVVQLIPGD